MHSEMAIKKAIVIICRSLRGGLFSGIDLHMVRSAILALARLLYYDIIMRYRLNLYALGATL